MSKMTSNLERHYCQAVARRIITKAVLEGKATYSRAEVMSQTFDCRLPPALSVCDQIGVDLVPSTINLDAFWNDIEKAVSMFRVFSEVGSEALRRKRRKHEDRISKAIRKLVNLLEDEHGRWALRQIKADFMRRDPSAPMSHAAEYAIERKTHSEECHFEADEEFHDRLVQDLGRGWSRSITQWRDDTKRIAELLEAKIKETEAGRGASARITTSFESAHSGFEELVGVYLASVYLRYVGRKPGVTRGAAGVPAGPFVRFVLAVLAAKGVTHAGDKKYTAESVATAWAKAGHSP